MTRPSKKTPTKVGRLKAAHARGASVREAAAEAGIPKSTAHRWAKKAKGRVPDAPTAAEVDAVLHGPKPIGLAAITERAEVVRALLRRLEGPVERDEFPATGYVQIARYLDELDRLVVELTPPAPKDPDQDEKVIAAEAVFLERLTGLIEAAERSAA